MAKKGNSKKRKKNNIENINDSFETDLWSKIYIVLGIIVFFCLFYLLTIYITNKNTDSESTSEETSEVTVSYDKIIAGRSFSMGDGEYLVLYYDNTDEDLSNKVNEIKSNYNALKIYTVDMHDALNKVYKSEEANTHPTNASEIKINGPTLIKFANGEVADYIEGIDSISNYLK